MNKTLKSEFISSTLDKIQKVINSILEYYNIEMQYDINERNKLFCEIIRKTKTDLIKSDMFQEIHSVLWSNEKEDLTTPQSEWLSETIYEFHKDIFLLHYFYAALYSYNYDAEIREKITEEHVKKFFDKANEIYKKYKAHPELDKE